MIILTPVGYVIRSWPTIVRAFAARRGIDPLHLEASTLTSLGERRGLIAMSCFDLGSDRDLRLDERVDIDFRSRRPDCNDQCVTRQTIIAIEERFFLPPSTDRKHADRVPLGEICGRAAPHVGMDRASIAKGAE